MFYHVSGRNDLKILEPRVPKSAYQIDYENRSIPRVCFSTSIEGCLSAISPNVYSPLYVYTTLDDNPDLYKPSVNEVVDTDINDEYWSLEPIELKYIGSIVVLGIKCEQWYPNPICEEDEIGFKFVLYDYQFTK